MKENKIVLVFIFISVLITAQQTSHAHPQKREVPFKKPTVAEIKNSLFELINKERKKRAFPPLTLSKDLSSLAKKHSQDMASHATLSHVRKNHRYPGGAFWVSILLEE